MNKKGKELIFISQINRDGIGVQIVDKEYIKYMKNDNFELHNLSLTKKTFIAFNMNVFIVKLK